MDFFRIKESIEQIEKMRGVRINEVSLFHDTSYNAGWTIFTFYYLHKHAIHTTSEKTFCQHHQNVLWVEIIVDYNNITCLCARVCVR